jgi:hypothetical protein
MKRYSLTIIAFFFGMQILSAQNEVDVLRFSQSFIMGTARSVGMGGAVGALGGDFTSVSVNPAGLGIYRGSEFTITPAFNWNVTTSDFLNQRNESSQNSFNLANFGFVSCHDLNQESGWISTNFAFGYNTLNNYNQRILMAGINNQNCFLDDFPGLSDDPNSGEFLYYKDLALQDSLLVFDNSTQKLSNDFQIDGYGQYQERYLTSTGSKGEYTFSFGANYNHTIYLGGTLGVQRIRYDRNFLHTEADRTNKITYVDKFIFYEDQSTRGYGFDLKLGAIGRPVDFLKVGVAFHVPSIYFLKDWFSTDLTAYYDDYTPKTAYSPFGENHYRIRTPYKIVVSAAGTIGKVALLSIDYEFIDYTSAKIESDYDSFTDANYAVDILYKPASNIKVGGEVRFSSIYLRGGYAFYGSPYAMVDPKADESHNVISGGIGFRSSSVFVDFSLSRNSFDQAYYMYKSQVATGALNSSDGNHALLTVGYKF